jgi:hypothetical protein
VNEDALRAMVRESIARYGAGGQAEPSYSGPAAEPLPFAIHPSHFRYTLPKTDGPCLIEPTVPCNHCGYCESHGH